MSPQLLGKIAAETWTCAVHFNELLQKPLTLFKRHFSFTIIDLKNKKNVTDIEML